MLRKIESKSRVCKVERRKRHNDKRSPTASFVAGVWKNATLWAKLDCIIMNGMNKMKVRYENRIVI